MLRKLLFPEVVEMKLLSSNLLKGNWVQFQNDDTRVINSNKILEERIGPVNESVKKERAEGFTGGLNAEELTSLTVDPEEGSNVIKSEQPPAPPEPVYEGPSPEELIAQAQEEIAQMRRDAEEEIEIYRQQVMEQARQEGKSQGYTDGMAAAQAEADETKRRLEAAYNERLHELEPELVKQLTGIYEHIFHMELGEYQNLVMQLLEGCMQRIETSSSYIIHVSPDDYPFVSMQKKMLIEGLGNRNAMLEVVEDMMMKKNECMIEADDGIYDCSLDIQLTALRRELLVLSYEGVE